MSSKANTDTELTYDELKLPFYTNSNVVLRVPARVDGEEKTLEFTLTDIVLAAELAGLNMLFISDTGRGKTQLVSDLAWYHFGGDGDKGEANWADGRPEFEIEELFVRSQADLSSGRYDSDEARQLKEDRVRRLLFVLDEANRAPKLKQNNFFDVAEGKYSFRGVRRVLGRDGYSLFMATANLNKKNGDFAGTSEFDRALLNRAHLTIDLDHPSYRPTAADKIIIRQRKASPKVDVPEPRNISSKILAANKRIISSAKMDPYLLAFQFLIDDGLDYCDKDRHHEKGPAFPMRCQECDYSGKDLCSLVKSSSERTTNSVALMAYALSHLAELKYGQKVTIDPLDSALQAFRFTTYHGNLNGIMVDEVYDGRKQMMMDETVEKLKNAVGLLKEYLPAMLSGCPPNFLVRDGEERRYYDNGEGYLSQMKELLAARGKAFTERKLQDELKTMGLGSDWVSSYFELVCKKKVN